MYSIKEKLPKFPISIKSDMTTEEHANEKILLKQHWLLSQKSIDRKQL